MPHSVSLFAVTSGDPQARPLVILHGLLGSSRNWAGIQKLLANAYDCHALDLRNHGNSPYAPSMDYAGQAADVVSYLEANGIETCILVGHSMGGKVAMAVAANAPEKVSHLVVVDIAPKAYAPRWQAEFAAMRSLDVGSMRTRAEAEAALEPTVPDWAFRKFLLSNLDRRAEGGFVWRVNLPLLEASLPQIFAHSLEGHEGFSGPTLFLRGERSNYVLDDDLHLIRQHFPKGVLRTVEEAGHTVHFDQPVAFASALEEFVKA